MSDFLALLFSATVTVATVVYACLTRTLVRETVKLREAETEPELSVYVVPQERSVMLMDMVVRNIGRGAAHAIRWTVGLSEEEGKARSIYLVGMNLFRGLRYLAPGETIRFTYGQTVNLLKQPPMEPYVIAATYENGSGRAHTSEFTIDVEEWRGLSMTGKPPLFQIARSLEQIQKSQERLVRVVDWDHVRVETITHAQRAKAHDELDREVRQERVENATTAKTTAKDAKPAKTRRKRKKRGKQGN